MATLSEICTLPKEWGELVAQKVRNRQIGMSKKMEWKMQKKAEHQKKLVARAKAKAKATKRHTYAAQSSLSMGVNVAAPKTEERNIFAACKGQPIRKRVKNTFSKEQNGTVGTYIRVARFEGSRLVCVCKTRKI